MSNLIITQLENGHFLIKNVQLNWAKDSIVGNQWRAKEFLPYSKEDKKWGFKKLRNPLFGIEKLRVVESGEQDFLVECPEELSVAGSYCYTIVEAV